MADTVATLLTERAELLAEIERLRAERERWRDRAIVAEGALTRLKTIADGMRYRVDL